MEEKTVQQKVSRYGITINGKHYWNEDLIMKYHGKMVKVAILESSINVFELEGNLIATFNR
ncbi:Mu transposase C-terminal domain-containing protein [Lachnospiraceae bacterium 54-53]